MAELEGRFAGGRRMLGSCRLMDRGRLPRGAQSRRVCLGPVTGGLSCRGCVNALASAPWRHLRSVGVLTHGRPSAAAPKPWCRVSCARLLAVSVGCVTYTFFFSRTGRQAVIFPLLNLSTSRGVGPRESSPPPPERTHRRTGGWVWPAGNPNCSFWTHSLATEARHLARHVHWHPHRHGREAHRWRGVCDVVSQGPLHARLCVPCPFSGRCASSRRALCMSGSTARARPRRAAQAEMGGPGSGLAAVGAAREPRTSERPRARPGSLEAANRSARWHSCRGAGRGACYPQIGRAHV